MAGAKDPGQTLIISEKKKIQDERKELQKQQRQQRKEAKKRAKEIAKREDALNDGEGGGFATFFATFFVVVVWLAVIAVIIKLDIGGFGSNVLAPVLKDVPVLNKILPGVHLTETTNPEMYGGYSNLQDAVNQIELLEKELEKAYSTNTMQEEQLTDLKAEVVRLQEFEKCRWISSVLRLSFMKKWFIRIKDREKRLTESFLKLWTLQLQSICIVR